MTDCELDAAIHPRWSRRHPDLNILINSRIQPRPATYCRELERDFDTGSVALLSLIEVY